MLAIPPCRVVPSLFGVLVGRVLALTILASALGPIGQAEAISATCLPGGFPTEPTPPVTSKNATWGTSPPSVFRMDIWRVPCQDGSGQTALLLRDIVQGGQQFDGTLRQPGNSSFCGDLLSATTFSLEKSFATGPPFNNTEAFTLIHDGFTAGNTIVDVPAAGAQFGITVVATGCTTCQVGQLAEFHMRVTNPGLPISAEVKTAIHVPGGAVGTLLGICTFDTYGTGETDVPIVGVIVPGDAPKGTYAVEAALLDPITGETLARNSRQATVQ
jgi:hypothetical protein